MVLGKAAHGHVGDRRLSTKGTIEPVKSEIFPSPDVKAMPRLRSRLFRRDLDLNEVSFIRIFGGKIRQPIVLAFLCQPPAEDAAEFFTAPSTNSTVIRESFCAHQSTADKTSR